jgi:hypothetical protein
LQKTIGQLAENNRPACRKQLASLQKTIGTGQLSSFVSHPALVLLLFFMRSPGTPAVLRPEEGDMLQYGTGHLVEWTTSPR